MVDSATLNVSPVVYGYDTSSRLHAVSSGNRVTEYTYTANSNLLHTTTLNDHTQ